MAASNMAVCSLKWHISNTIEPRKVIYQVLPGPVKLPSNNYFWTNPRWRHPLWRPFVASKQQFVPIEIIIDSPLGSQFESNVLAIGGFQMFINLQICDWCTDG